MNKKIISWIMVIVFALGMVCVPYGSVYAGNQLKVKKIKLVKPKKKTIKLEKGQCKNYCKDNGWK